MKQKSIFFLTSLITYLILFFIEETLFTFILTLMQAPFYTNFILTVLFTIVINPFITWNIVKRINGRFTDK